MSHTHEDRVAQQDPRQCCAYGCPMPGTMSASTTGTSEWQCWLHYGRNPGSWQRITTEANRMGWLVHALVTLRRDYGSRRWADTFTEATKTIKAAQRSDLTWARGETVPQWLMRLDAALRQACAPEPVPQQSLIVKQESSEKFTKVEFELPA
jgi:hypothetical protein